MDDNPLPTAADWQPPQPTESPVRIPTFVYHYSLPPTDPPVGAPIKWYVSMNEIIKHEAKEAAEEAAKRPKKLAGWGISFIGILFCLLILKYWRSKKSKKNIRTELDAFKQGIREEMDAFRDSAVGLRTATTMYLPTVSQPAGETSAEAEHPKSFFNSEQKQSKAQVNWCWKETRRKMGNHSSDEIVGDPANCWIKYKKKTNAKLEAAFQEQGRAGTFDLSEKSTVNFSTNILSKNQTGKERDIQRIVIEPDDPNMLDTTGGEASPKRPIRQVDLSTAKRGGPLPLEISGEPQMVFVIGDVIQIVKQRQDGWAFGTKLFHADEVFARDIATQITSQNVHVEDPKIFTDTGWFLLDATQVSSANDLAALQKSLGDSHVLEAPSHWDAVKDPSFVQHHELDKNDLEYIAVVSSFMLTMQNRDNVKIVKVERIQNLAMWQSYVVKRQTICYRETGLSGRDQSNEKAVTIHRKVLERFEKSWLWHGTDAGVRDKILQQGFNRSFCGKHATVYGKGVYFARDASYSSRRRYAVPDDQGHQYVMACRVVVGEYCEGVTDSLTPTVRDPKTQSLYDSTVGLLSDDSMANPSIYVTYHDAQAYPDYLIEFTQP